MRLAIALAAMLSGCIFCGPPTYFSSPPEAVVGFVGANWSEAVAQRGVGAVAPGEGTPSAENQTNTPRFVMRSSVGCTASNEAKVYDCLNAEKDRVRPRVEEAVAAFERATNWTRSGNITWAASGIGHGDC